MWEGDGKKAMQREKMEVGEGKNVCTCTCTHICTLPGGHGQGLQGSGYCQRCPLCSSTLGPWSLSRTDPSRAAGTCQGETQGPWNLNGHRPLAKLPFGVPVSATAAGYLWKPKVLFNFFFLEEISYSTYITESY